MRRENQRRWWHSPSRSRGYRADLKVRDLHTAPRLEIVMTESQRFPQLVSTDAGLTVAAVARRLGVAPATLRTWDRRYDLGPSEHSAGTHRRYNATDVARLDLMRRLLNQGVAPQEAARIAKAQDVSAQAQAITSSRGRSSGVGGLCRKCSKSVMGFTALPAPEYQRPDSRPVR